MNALSSCCLYVILLVLPLCVTAQSDRPPTSRSSVEDTVRLSALIGEVHGLTVLCEGRANQAWRAQLLALLDLEAPFPGGRRSALIDAFNRGYLDAQNRFGVCTQEAREDRLRLAARGKALAETLATPYLR